MNMTTNSMLSLPEPIRAMILALVHASAKQDASGRPKKQEDRGYDLPATQTPLGQSQAARP